METSSSGGTCCSAPSSSSCPSSAWSVPLFHPTLGGAMSLEVRVTFSRQRERCFLTLLVESPGAFVFLWKVGESSLRSGANKGSLRRSRLCFLNSVLVSPFSCLQICLPPCLPLKLPPSAARCFLFLLDCGRSGDARTKILQTRERRGDGENKNDKCASRAAQTFCARLCRRSQTQTKEERMEGFSSTNQSGGQTASRRRLRRR